MITNQKQYLHLTALLKRVLTHIEHLETHAPSEGVHPDIHAATIDSLRVESQRMASSIREYEDLRNGVPQIDISSLAELPTALIKARIARGWSQRDLAERVGLKEQQIQRYELQRYKGASLDRMQEIAARLGIRAQVRLNLLPVSSDLDPASVLNWRRASLALIAGAVQEETGHPIQGRVALQKLMLRWSEQLGQRLGTLVFGHEPLHFGAYDEDLNEDVDALKSAGILTQTTEDWTDPPETDEELYSRIARRLQVEVKEDTYELTHAGLRRLKTFLDSDELAPVDLKRELAEMARRLARQAGHLPNSTHFEQTYEQFPTLAANSVIRDKVVARIRRRKRS